MGGRVGCAEALEREEVFFVTLVFPCVSMIPVVLGGRERGTCVEEGNMHGRGDMRGREWTCIAIDGRTEERKDRKKARWIFYYTLVFTAS